MSITTDLKSYADAAVETGRSVINDGISQGRDVVNTRITALRGALDEGFDLAGTRAGKFGETATGVGTQALDRARLNALAVVGAGDAAVTGLVARLQELPVELANTVLQAQNRAADAAERVQTRLFAAAGKAGGVVSTASGTVDGVRTGALFDQARGAAEALGKELDERRSEYATRGEAVVTELRKDPRFVRLAGLVGAATDAVEDAAAAPARHKSAEKAAATRARNARSASAKKAASTRARKSAGASARKTTAQKTARKTAPRKSTATKATS